MSRIHILTFLGLCSIYYCQGDKFKCLNPWTRHGKECLFVGSGWKSWQDAHDSCQNMSTKASLVEIYDAETNTAVKELLQNTAMEYWINMKKKYDSPYYRSTLKWQDSGKLITSSSYHQFADRQSVFNNNRLYGQSHSTQCGYMDDNGKWYLTNKCDLRKGYICSKEAACEEGFYGADCAKVCNCYKSSCNRKTGVCPFGCKRGWKGEVCDIEKLPANASVHCFTKHNGDREALIRVDPLGVSYDDIYIINEQDNTPSCNISYFTNEDNGVLSLKLDLNEDGSNTLDCYTSNISENAFKWNLRTEEKKGFNNYYDREYQLTCNFDDADNLERDRKLKLFGQYGLKKVMVHQTNEKVQLIVQDPVTKQEIKNIEMGQNIQLALHLEKQSETVMAKGISPYNCTVSTSDHHTVRYLTDMDGCPGVGSPIHSLSAVGSSVESNIFEAFTLNGKTDLVFTCDFTYCYQSDDDKCIHICNSSHNSTRSKRSVRMMKDGTASAHLNVSHEGSSVFGYIILGLVGTMFVVMATIGSYRKWKQSRL